jgi:methylene-tetrahydromethanopterin dehydrogenase
MEKVSILHLITASKNASPFDVNMGYDAGFDKVVSYTNVALDEVVGLTQDAIFSRSPSGIKREGIFIGGRDIDLAMQMLNLSKGAMFSPFTCSVFADPSGAFTTAAAMVAKVEFHLHKHFGLDLSGKTLSVFGANGPVGSCAAIIAALQGATVQLVAHRAIAELEQKVLAWNTQFQINLQVVDGSSEPAKKQVLESTEIALCAAAAGVQVLSVNHLSVAKQLKIVADVNAVAPLGVAGILVSADGVKIEASVAYGIGAMAIGSLKYITQQQLLQQMLSADKPQMFEFMAAFKLATALLNH